MSLPRCALVSVSDKRGLAAFARELSELGTEIISTGGTRRHLEEAGVPVLGVSVLTGFPEILDGRVKTLHPRVHAGILADRRKEGHRAQLTEHGIPVIDLVVVNLYPFRETAARPGATYDEVIEQIDIGGPCMLRAAAKNHANCTVLVDPDDYPELLAALKEHGAVPEALRRRWAAKAFALTHSYDGAIADWLAAQNEGAGLFPERRAAAMVRELVPRYGENPHQEAALYREVGGAGVFGGFSQLNGKELSYNNLLDADAARKTVALFVDPAVVIVKHNNPCGVGRGTDLVTAYGNALACDPVSAFGSVIAVNREVDLALAEAMSELFVEVLLAPGFSDAALAKLRRKPNLRVLACPPYQLAAGAVELRAIDGGFLAQRPDGEPSDASAWTCPTRRAPSPEERRALELAWEVARATKSNAIVIAHQDATVGIGAGQMSRVDSCRIAVDKAQSPLAGTVAASDAFFPFRDGLDVLAAAGVTAVVQPGGSKRDDEVIAAADEHGMAMLFTGRRHFRH